MVRAEKAEKVMALKGTMTETEAAESLNVSVSTVRKLWGTTAAPVPVPTVSEAYDEDLADTAFIMAGYRRVVQTMRAEYDRYAQKEQENPDNCAWGNLKLKAAQTELKALSEMKETVGLGKIIFAGEDGYGYTERMIKQYVGTPKPPAVKEMEEDEDRYGIPFRAGDYDIDLF